MAENNKRPFFLTDNDIAAWTGYWHSLRRVLISGKLEEEPLRKTSLELLKLDYQNSEPITLMIESGGGDVVSTHQLEDMIATLNSPVDALVIRDCASMAVDLVQMCRKRFILPSARILVHYIRDSQRWICDDPDRLEEDIEYFRDRMRGTAERRLKLYMKRTGLPENKIIELFRQGEVHDIYFSAKQAVELHLADEIKTDFKFFPRKPHEEKK